MPYKKYVLLVSAALAFGAWCGSGNSQPWPSKPVRVIVPYGAGGGTDVLVRLLGKRFHESTGQTFVLDNRPGASGQIGAEITKPVQDAPPLAVGRNERSWGRLDAYPKMKG